MAGLRIAQSGLVLGLRALLGKELRSRSRGWRSMWVLTIYLGLLTVIVCGFVALAERTGGTIPTGLGTWLFSSLALGSLVLLAFVTPGLTTGAISGERERRTLELLLVTRASPLGLVLGKLLGSLAYILFLIAASLPAFALVYLFGGVPIKHLLMVLAVLVTTAVTHAAIGLGLSALLKRTVFATVATYFVVLGLVLGIPFVSVALGIAAVTSQSGYPAGFNSYAPSSSYYGGPGSSPASTTPAPPRRELVPPSAYLMASPVASLASVLPSETSGGAPMVGSIAQMALGGRLGSIGTASQGVPFGYSIYTSSVPSASDPPVIAFSPWVYYFVVSWSLVVVSVLLASLAIAPVKPWRKLAVRRRRARARLAESAA
jgi:ABC-type transport system involved in multi-copper enzyme maturation permease subunit